MKPITTDEIEYASSVLFEGELKKFYDDEENKTGERIEVIQSLEGIDINACPGSGKTTALLAKLIILANRMPLEDGRGICVLTHTNVAIDLIKEKLGNRTVKLFSHPNFFGTIQSFVDRFLATPAIIEKYGVRPDIVDNDRANAMLFEKYFNGRTKLNSRIFITLFSKHSQFSTKELSEILAIKRDEAKKIIDLLKKEKIIESTRSPFHLNYGNSKKANIESKLSGHSMLKEIVDALLGIRNNALVQAKDYSNQAEELRSLNLNFIKGMITEKEDNYARFNTDSGKVFLDLKEDCFRNGLITFSDAYNFAELYLHKYPDIRKAFVERFKYVFIDEMQDTSLHQINIINSLFNNEGDTIVQYYGDPNQAIFESEGQKDGGWNPDPNSPTTLKLKKSKRFGTSIAHSINPLRIILDKEKTFMSFLMEKNHIELVNLKLNASF